jgi:beta-1,4-mannosyl-glycoprotein beta-1,4-N-acetylglucosaminyltransferase
VTVWHLTTFLNELDVLEIKLATLDHLIDRYVIAEANVTQRGDPKPLILNDALTAQPRFSRWRHKIEVIEVTDMPTEQDPESTLPNWDREHHQRNALIGGCDGLHDDDAVMIGDLDELPYPRALDEALNVPDFAVRFPMDMHVYHLNWRWPERPVHQGSATVVQPGHAFWDEWDGARPVHDVLLGMPATWRCGDEGVPISSGWHLAYMGDAAHIAAKTLAIADDGYLQLVPEEKRAAPREFWSSLDWAQHCIDTGEDVYGRDERQAERVGLETLPPYVAENPALFAHLLG